MLLFPTDQISFSLSGIMAHIAAKIEFLVILARSIFRVIAPIVLRSFLS